MLRLAALTLSLALSACAPPPPSPDAQTDAQPDAEPQSDAQSDDVAVESMDSGPDAEPDAEPMDTGVIVDTGIPPRDAGVPPVDTGVRDTGLPPCTLDPRNCGMCGRVCGAGVLSGRPACAEVGPARWDCVQFCDGFGEGCGYPGGGAVCCASGCGVIDMGCR